MLIAKESTLAQIKNVFNEFKKILECPQCKTTSALPKVVGPCGHALCEGCINTMPAGLAKQSAETCTFCASPTIGQGFPVEALTVLMRWLPLNTKIDHALIETLPNIQMISAYVDREAGKRAFLNLKLPPPADDVWRQGIVFQFPLKCPPFLIEGFKSAVTGFFIHDMKKINLWTLDEGLCFIVNVYSHDEVVQSSPKKGKVIKIDPYDFFAKNYPPENSDK